VPRTTPTWIQRPHLLELLSASASHKLLVIAAPGGYGKSTLLAQWCAGAEAGAAIAWLTLDAEDAESSRFFHYLRAAISTATGDNDLAPAIAAPPRMTSLIAMLETRAEPLYVVLDDFHLLGGHALIHELSALIRRSPANVHWIVSGRCIPELELSHHKLHDDLASIDATNLRFIAEEVVVLAERLCELSLSASDAASLCAATEGWPAGIKLALLAHPPAIGTVSGASGDIAQYLRTAILEGVTPQIREVLLATAIIERFNGELCGHLLAVDNGLALVNALERAQLFIQALDNEQRWFRYHSLFREFLRTCLQQQHAERIPELQHRASLWYAQQHLYEAALEHAFAGADHLWCIELTARAARTWLKEGEINRILRWVGRLSRAQSLQHEIIGPIHITCLIWRRRFKEAAAALQETRMALLAGDQSPATRARLRTLQLMLDIASGCSEHVDLSEELPSDERVDTFLAGALMTLQAYGLLGRCRFDLARRLALRAREIMQHHDSAYALGYVNVVIALADRAQGDVQSVIERVEQMFATVKDTQSTAWSNAAAVLARVRYEQNRLVEAETLCTQVLPQVANAALAESFTVVHMVLARIKASQGMYEESFKLLDYVHSMLESDSQHGFIANICCEKMRLHLRCGHRDRARALAKDFGLPQRLARGDWAEPREYSMTWEQLSLAQVALLLDAQQFDTCRQILNGLLASVYAVGFVGRAVPLEALLATCEWRAGEPSAAFAALNRGLLLTRKTGFTRCCFDEAPGLASIINAAVEGRRLQQPLPQCYVEKFQDVFAVAYAEGPSRIPRVLPLEPLTSREAAILFLLAQGLSNQQISERSQIALSTTKWHLKNVFAKLDVSTRTSALARAKELNLIG
jgi:LuxR family maltose regulon positive regulatory protein